MADIYEKFRNFCERHGGNVVYWRSEHPDENHPKGYCRGVDLNSVNPSEVIDLLNEMGRSLKEKGYAGIEVDVEGVNRKEGFLIAVTHKRGKVTQEKIELPRGMFEREQTKRLAERIIEEVGRRADFVHVIGYY